MSDVVMFAEFGWPHAVATLGIAWALAFAWWAFFWALSRDVSNRQADAVASQAEIDELRQAAVAPLWTYERGSTTVDESDEESS